MGNKENGFKPKGFICLDDVRKVPFYGTVNDYTLAEWNALAARMAIKHYIQDHNGQQPESAEEAFAYEKAKHEGLKRMQPKEKQEIPIRSKGSKIVYYQ